MANIDDSNATILGSHQDGRDMATDESENEWNTVFYKQIRDLRAAVVVWHDASS
jgi:hypothetical protein